MAVKTVGMSPLAIIKDHLIDDTKKKVQKIIDEEIINAAPTVVQKIQERLTQLGLDQAMKIEDTISSIDFNREITVKLALYTIEENK